MKQFTSNIDFSLTRKRFEMMSRSSSPFRSGSKTALILPLLGLLMIVLGTERTADNYRMSIPDQTYDVPELHFDRHPSEEAGVPYAAFTSSGELFTGTQKVYYTENDSLYMTLYYEDGIETGSLMIMNGDVIRQKKGWYRNAPYLKESYNNGVLVWKHVPPAENENGLGYVHMWHQNGQLAFEVSYTGDPMDKVYQGLMTEYDEEGNITMQKRYEDGELVETIK